MKFHDYLLTHYDIETTSNIEKSLNNERTSSLIINKNKFSQNDLLDIALSPHPLIKNAFYFDNSINKLGVDYRFKNGMFYIQDASSMLPVHFLNVEKNDFILDMCAAPGGKTIDAAIELDNTGSIIANDLSYERARVLSSNVEKMGFSNIIVTNNDLTKIYTHYPSTFDKIILDAPCSGSFMFRKNSFAEEDWSISKISACSRTQEQLLNIAAFMLKPGGKISYSTCSLSPEENEQIITDFLKNHEDFSLVQLPKNEYSMESKIQNRCYYFMPFLFKGEGQFIAILQKLGTKIFETFLPGKIEFNSAILDFYHCNFSNVKRVKDEVYAFNKPAELKYFNILKYGLHVSTIKGNAEIPSFHMAHYLPATLALDLSDKEKEIYLSGNELTKNVPNGFYIVKYKNLNLGFSKAVNGTLKNYYPKGLRKPN